MLIFILNTGHLFCCTIFCDFDFITHIMSTVCNLQTSFTKSFNVSYFCTAHSYILISAIVCNFTRDWFKATLLNMLLVSLCEYTYMYVCNRSSLLVLHMFSNQVIPHALVITLNVSTWNIALADCLHYLWVARPINVSGLMSWGTPNVFPKIMSFPNHDWLAHAFPKSW